MTISQNITPYITAYLGSILHYSRSDTIAQLYITTAH